MIQSKRKLWWPDFESAHEEVEDYIVKRMTDADVVAAHAKTKGVALQAGGHVGLFPRQLAKIFGFVYTFEAIPEMFQCLQRNTEYIPNILPQFSALGAEDGIVQMEPRRSGRSRVSLQGIAVPQTTIDTQHLVRCDLIYLDVEGYELNVLAGAIMTITKFRPVIALEVLNNPGQYDRVKRWADENQYSLVQRIHSDWIFTP